MRSILGFLVLGLLIYFYYTDPIFQTPTSQPQSPFETAQLKSQPEPTMPLYALLQPVPPPTLLDPRLQTQNSSCSLFKPQYFALTYYCLNHPINNNPQSIHYWVNYASDCRYKEIPLKDAILIVKVYYNGNPMGFINITTDNLQHFSFYNDKFKETSLVSIEVLGIQTDKEHQAKCYGYVQPGHTELLIKCDEIQQKG